MNHSWLLTGSQDVDALSDSVASIGAVDLVIYEGDEITCIIEVNEYATREDREKVRELLLLQGWSAFISFKAEEGLPLHQVITNVSTNRN